MKTSRRRFLQTTAVSAAGLTLLANPASVHSAPANDRIGLALIGCGGRGRNLADTFLARTQNDVRFLYCADPLRDKAELAAGQLARDDHKPSAVQDLRTALEDSGVDGVIVATPDHWHALATIWACQAGKDVFTEKPASWTAWEGEQMVRAARKFDRVVQLGTQNRSAPYNIAAKKYIDDGHLGTVHFCRVYNMKFQNAPIHLVEGEPVPENLDWNLWTGPAAEHAYSPTWLRQWYWMWDFANGDMGNDSIHQLDLARWLIGREIPRSAYSVGGNFVTEGVRNTPDTQTAVFEFDGLTLNFELTQGTPYMLKTDPVVRNSDMFPYWLQNGTRIEIYGTKGMMIVGRHGGGWQVFIRPKDRKPVVPAQEFGRFPDPEHHENFLACMRDRKRPNADIEIGHRSTLLVHYGCISYRLGGRKLDIDPTTGAILNTPEAQALWKPQYRKPFDIEEVVKGW